MAQKVSDLFDVEYGHSLSLNKLTQTTHEKGIAFVSRTARNNGVSAWVEELAGVEPLPAGLLTVSLRSRNHALATFVQPRPFYCGYHLFVLRPRVAMSLQEKMWWAQCIEANRYRYNFGRQANRSLASIPLPDEVPGWVSSTTVPDFSKQVEKDPEIGLQVDTWRPFRLSDIFDLQRGQRFVQRDLAPGATPYIRASALNNGVSSWVDMDPMFPGGAITVSSNGSVGEAFYQPIPFVASDDIVVLTPKSSVPPEALLFCATVIRAEKYRFNYGRKWFTNRMADHKISLPADSEGDPDWGAASRYVQSLSLANVVF
ncbi:restriction endonuclease subunit S [Streptomyces albogriseolus]|uniref:restriction endonuclease subunit S n=1 Tax=Streptomyces albogriseolus TaxID=1887 RepID=UPI0036FB3407